MARWHPNRKAGVTHNWCSWDARATVEFFLNQVGVEDTANLGT
jgi:hypothetical protein